MRRSHLSPLVLFLGLCAASCSEEGGDGQADAADHSPKIGKMSPSKAAPSPATRDHVAV